MCLVYKLLSRSTASVVLDSSDTAIIDPRQRVLARRIEVRFVDIACNIYIYKYKYSRTQRVLVIARSVRKNAVS